MDDVVGRPQRKSGRNHNRLYVTAPAPTTGWGVWSPGHIGVVLRPHHHHNRLGVSRTTYDGLRRQMWHARCSSPLQKNERRPEWEPDRKRSGKHTRKPRQHGARQRPARRPEQHERQRPRTRRGREGKDAGGTCGGGRCPQGPRIPAGPGAVREAAPRDPARLRPVRDGDQESFRAISRGTPVGPPAGGSSGRSSPQTGERS